MNMLTRRWVSKLQKGKKMKDTLGTRMCQVLMMALCMVGCCERVDDIDRTLGNLVSKKDLNGEWFLLQTVVHVPPTSAFTFIGDTSKMERVKWVVQRDLLIAYRAYPKIRGALNPTTDPGTPTAPNDNPVAAYPILAHVDIM